MVFARETRGFDIGDAFSTWIGNIFSRAIGAMMRLFFLGAGAAAELAVLILGAAVFIIWFLLFLLMPFSLVYGIMLLSV